MTDHFSVTVALIRWVLIPSFGAAAISAVLFLVYRNIARDSSLLGNMVGLGIVFRVALGVGLFFVSFLDLPVLTGLHTGDGFWRLTPDAKSYYLSAVTAAEHGLDTISPYSASPAYVQMLAVWMKAVGTSPASALLLNLVCYVLGCSLIILTLRSAPARWRRPVSAFSVGAFTCSPTLIFFGTQPLKDTFFAFLTVLAAVGACYVSSSFSDVARRFSWRRVLLGSSCVLAAIYLTAGIRAYYAFLVWVCLGLLFIACGAERGLSGLRTVAATACVTLAAAWIAFMVGAGAYAAPYASLMGIEVGPRSALMLVTMRNGFIKTGGGTSVVQQPVDDKVSLLSFDAPLSQQARALAIGLSTLFVPMSVLRGLSIVTFAGGRGMLSLTDVDTLFLDLTLVVGALILIRGWADMRSNLPYVVFSVSLTLLLTILMAYVVTNYGTLIRLRLMLAVPVWVLPLAMCRFGELRGAVTTSTADFDKTRIST